MWDVGRDQIEDPILGELDDKGAPIMADHINPWLQESGQSRFIEDGNPSFGVVNVAFTPPAIFDVCDMRRGKNHAIPVDFAHALFAVLVVLLHHDDVIWQCAQPLAHPWGEVRDVNREDSQVFLLWVVLPVLSPIP